MEACGELGSDCGQAQVVVVKDLAERVLQVNWREGILYGPGELNELRRNKDFCPVAQSIKMHGPPEEAGTVPLSGTFECPFHAND